MCVYFAVFSYSLIRPATCYVCYILRIAPIEKPPGGHHMKISHITRSLHHHRRRQGEQVAGRAPFAAVTVMVMAVARDSKIVVKLQMGPGMAQKAPQADAATYAVAFGAAPPPARFAATPFSFALQMSVIHCHRE